MRQWLFLRPIVLLYGGKQVRITPLFWFLLLWASSCVAQVQTATKDPRAVALAEGVLVSGGGVLQPGTGISIQGTIQFGEDSASYPLRIYALGTGTTRTEVDGQNGLNLRVLSGGKAASQTSSGHVRNYNMINTISERIPYIPALSLLADYKLPAIQLDYLGSSQLNGIHVEQIAVYLIDPTQTLQKDELTKHTRTEYSIDPNTMQVVQMKFKVCAENNSEAIRTFRIVYSNYISMGRRQIPTTLSEFDKDTVLYKISLTAYSEHPDLSGISFVLPGNRDAK